MLTEAQSKYLDTLPENKKVLILPHSPKLKEIAEDLIAKVQAIHPEIESLFGGAAGLGISGQNDLDIDFLINPSDLVKYLPTFIQLFGEARVSKEKVAAWSFEIEGVEVDLWLTDKTSPEVQEQHRLFYLLRDNPDLLREYEELKQTFNGKEYKDYQSAKYEFYNRVLGVK